MSEVNKELLTKHVAAYLEKLQGSEYLSDDDANERRDRQKYYESWTKERLLNISEEEFFEYLSKLWAMKTWGNKKYYVDKVISDNGVKHIGTQLAMLVWGENDIAERWDDFRVNTKGMGIAMMSEISAWPPDMIERGGLEHSPIGECSQADYKARPSTRRV